MNAAQTLINEMQEMINDLRQNETWQVATESERDGAHYDMVLALPYEFTVDQLHKMVDMVAECGKNGFKVAIL